MTVLSCAGALNSAVAYEAHWLCFRLFGTDKDYRKAKTIEEKEGKNL